MNSRSVGSVVRFFFGLVLLLLLVSELILVLEGSTIFAHVNVCPMYNLFQFQCLLLLLYNCDVQLSYTCVCLLSVLQDSWTLLCALLC